MEIQEKNASRESGQSGSVDICSCADCVENDGDWNSAGDCCVNCSGTAALFRRSEPEILAAAFINAFRLSVLNSVEAAEKPGTVVAVDDSSNGDRLCRIDWPDDISDNDPVDGDKPNAPKNMLNALLAYVEDGFVEVEVIVSDEPADGLVMQWPMQTRPAKMGEVDERSAEQA